MPGSWPNRLLAMTAAAVALGGFCALETGSAGASASGILPPANPAADCDHSGTNVRFTIAALDACRAKENVGRLELPRNWRSLSEPEQVFVLIDLERVNRGLKPVIGLSSALDQLAAEGARARADPAFPSGGFTGGGGIWFGGDSAVAADYVWMYDDGPDGLDINLDCSYVNASGCWRHRDIILWRGSSGPLVAGGGYSSSSDAGSYAFEMLTGYQHPALTFTWANELRFFAKKPALEPLDPLADPANSAIKHGRKHHKRKHRRHHEHTKPGVKRKPGTKRGSDGSGIAIIVG